MNRDIKNGLIIAGVSYLVYEILGAKIKSLFGIKSEASEIVDNVLSLPANLEKLAEIKSDIAEVNKDSRTKAEKLIDENLAFTKKALESGIDPDTGEALTYERRMELEGVRKFYLDNASELKYGVSLDKENLSLG